MHIVFFGSGAFGVPTLERLSREHTVSAVITQPDRPAGRGGKLAPTPVGEWTASNLPVVELLKPQKVNDPAIVQRVRSARADAWVVIAFGQKLGRSLLADRFAINLHASLLPRWRGAAPIHAAILAGDTITGNSVITLAETMDAGLVLGQSRRDIPPSVTAGELHDLLAADGPDLVMKVLRDSVAGALQPRPQDESAVTLAGKLSKQDAWIDWRRPAAECRRRVHGLNPWPGVTVLFRSGSIKLLRVEEVDTRHGQVAGSILDPQHGDVACGDGSVLRIVTVQPLGGKPMSWAEFARGRRPTVGELLVGGDAGC